MIHKFYNSDHSLIFVTLILVCFGLLMVYSSSAIVVAETKSDQFFVLKKQILWTSISIMFFLLFLLIDYKYLQKFVLPAVLLTFALLLAVHFFGKPIRGVKRWLDFGPLNFQVAEFAKFSIILFLANYLDKNKSKLKNFFTGFLPPILIVGLMVVLIIVQPDLGIPFVSILTMIGMFFIAGVKILHLVVVFFLSLSGIFYFLVSEPYRLERLLSFLNPWKYSTSSAYQLCQSLMALGSGGIFGKGLGRSELKEFFLPEAYTDFIFSIIGEELGIFGSTFVVLAFVYFLIRGYKIAKEAKDFFGTLLGFGITLGIVIQAFFNIAVCSGCLPTKGITLPFFSYGGSSLLLTLSAVGVLANISQHKRKLPKFK
ncbi:MAG: putative lipid II flippase FtsW [Elusimicrobiota bacterium]|nr:putative lipid II flippase FtsW [Elusimicrobiota bacterium]